MSMATANIASSATPIAVYLWAGGEIVANVTTGFYYFQDGRGNTTHLTNPSNVLIERYTYDLNGTVSYFDGNGYPMTSSSVGNRFLFAGTILLPEASLYDMRNRVYFPRWGRFLQTDPIGFQGDASNLYRYCHNDPVDGSDPTGLYDRNSDFWHNLTEFYNGNPSINSILVAWNDPERRGALSQRAVNSFSGVVEGAASYGRGVVRGVSAIVDLTGLRGEEAKAEQQQAIKDITSAGRIAREHPKETLKVAKLALKHQSSHHPERIAGRMLTGMALGAVQIPVGSGAIPLSAVLTPLAVFGDSTHKAIEVRRAAEALGAGELLDAVLTGGAGNGHR